MATIDQSGQDGGDDGIHLLSAEDGGHVGTPHLAAEDGGHVGTPHLSAQDGGQVIAPGISQCAVQGSIDISITSQPTVNTTANTIVHMDRAVDLGTSPTPAMCHVCQRQIHTRVVYESGGFTWAICALLCLFGMICGCCLIPFCVGSCKDAYHSCPFCNTPLSVSKKC